MNQFPIEVIDFKQKQQTNAEFDNEDPIELCFPLPKLLFSERAVLELLDISRYKLIKEVKAGNYPLPRRIGGKKACWTYQDLKEHNLIADKTDILGAFYAQIDVKEKDVCEILDVCRMTLRTNDVFPKPQRNNWIYSHLVAFVEALPEVAWRDMKNVTKKH